MVLTKSCTQGNPSKNVVSANESKDLRVLFCDYGFDEYTRDLVLINQCEVFQFCHKTNAAMIGFLSTSKVRQTTVSM